MNKKINKVIGLPVKLKGFSLYTHPGLPDTHDFLPFILLKDLGKGRVRIAMRGTENTYSVNFPDLEFTDENERITREKVNSILYS